MTSTVRIKTGKIWGFSDYMSGRETMIYIWILGWLSTRWKNACMKFGIGSKMGS